MAGGVKTEKMDKKPTHVDSRPLKTKKENPRKERDEQWQQEVKGGGVGWPSLPSFSQEIKNKVKKKLNKNNKINKINKKLEINYLRIKIIIHLMNCFKKIM